MHESSHNEFWFWLVHILYIYENVALEEIYLFPKTVFFQLKNLKLPIQRSYPPYTKRATKLFPCIPQIWKIERLWFLGEPFSFEYTNNFTVKYFVFQPQVLDEKHYFWFHVIFFAFERHCWTRNVISDYLLSIFLWVILLSDFFWPKKPFQKLRFAYFNLKYFIYSIQICIIFI